MITKTIRYAEPKVQLTIKVSSECTLEERIEKRWDIRAGDGQNIKPNERKSIIKNNNPDWHSSNQGMYCKVCKYTGTRLVNHYVNVHPNSEVHVSRVAPDVGDFLRQLKDDHECKRVKSMKANKSIRFRQFCYFCKESKLLTKFYWMDHLTIHTGCYRFKCTDCSKKFARNVNHVCKDKCNVEEVSQFQLEGANLMAYLCDLCNYIRFDKKDIEKHLRCQHDDVDVNRYKKVTFLSFPESQQEGEIVDEGED